MPLRDQASSLLRRLSDALAARGPAPRGVGVDVEDVARWREPRRRLSDHFSSEEMALAAAKSDPAPSFAGWWAAREAAVKALPGEGVTVRQISVRHDDDGAPHVVIRGREDLAASLDLSISHSDTTAVAVVVRR